MIADSALRARRTMPLCDGKILDPRYVPTPAREAYLAKWGEWLRANRYREPWMLDLIASEQHRSMSASRNSTGGSPPSTPPTATGPGDAPRSTP